MNVDAGCVHWTCALMLLCPLRVYQCSQPPRTRTLTNPNPDVEPLCRRATLDVIGRSGFGYEFRSVKFAADELKSGGGSSGAVDDNIDIIKVGALALALGVGLGLGLGLGSEARFGADSCPPSLWHSHDP